MNDQKFDLNDSKKNQDEWYIYDGKQIKGPYQTDEAFSLEPQTGDGVIRLVSRKGFTQWYNLKDLSEVYNYGKKRLDDTREQKGVVQAEIAKKNSSFGVFQETNMSENMEFQNVLKRKSSLEIESQRTSGLKVEKGKIRAERRNNESKNNSTLEKNSYVSDVMISSRTSLADRDFAMGHLATPSEMRPELIKKKVHLEKISGSKKSNSLLRDYFFAKRHLRLGTIRQPWITGMIGVPFSLGIGWFIWFRELAHEIRNHSPKYMYDLPPLWFAAIPVLHIYMTYSLAKEIARMEQENHYYFTDPRLAALLAVIPPLAVIYLQGSANRHWLLHVRHMRGSLRTEAPSPSSRWSPTSSQTALG